ncbi:MAG: error-prone DNA polymerase, partial [Hyphomicrobiales bacterium]|nr:error-prone DNA polymerase [Hyphomicrobiales bacterium]
AERPDPAREPDMALPPMPLGEQVVNDYRFLHLSLKAHPVSLLREIFAARGITPHERLAEIPAGRRVTVAGLVLVRQRPGSAKGVIFMTLEDETGVANAIVWAKVFERFRGVVIGARLVAVSGKLQSEAGVIHIVAEELVDLSPLLTLLSEDAGDLETLARGDEVKRPIIEIRDKLRPASRLKQLVREMPELGRDLERLAKGTARVMPKGRNFHSRRD